MMPRTLDQVLASLSSVYDPQTALVKQQQDALPGQQDAEQKGLDATKQNSFDDIMNQARARGVGFGGIPVGEQAKYTASSYLPAVANLHAAYVNKATSLQDAINQINEKRSTQAQSIYQYEQDFAESKRRYDEEAARTAAADAAAAGYSGANPTYGNNDAAPNQPAAANKYDSVDKQSAANALVGLFKTNNIALANQTINAIKASAARGNVYDQFKLELLTNNYLHSSPYASFIQKALAYKPPAAPAKPAPKVIPSQTGTGVLSLLTKK